MYLTIIRSRRDYIYYKFIMFYYVEQVTDIWLVYDKFAGIDNFKNMGWTV